MNGFCFDAYVLSLFHRHASPCLCDDDALSALHYLVGVDHHLYGFSCHLRALRPGPFSSPGCRRHLVLSTCRVHGVSLSVSPYLFVNPTAIYCDGACAYPYPCFCLCLCFRLLNDDCDDFCLYCGALSCRPCCELLPPLSSFPLSKMPSWGHHRRDYVLIVPVLSLLAAWDVVPPRCFRLLKRPCPRGAKHLPSRLEIRLGLRHRALDIWHGRLESCDPQCLLRLDCQPPSLCFFGSHI